MAYSSLEDCILDLERNRQLIRVKEEVDPNLQMAAIHLRVHEAGGPALLFENVKGTKFRAASNIFGTLERSLFVFRNTVGTVEDIIRLKSNPSEILKHPLKHFATGLSALKALPLYSRFSAPVLFEEISISALPLIKHWPMDGGAFVTLPQVYTEDPDQPGIMKSNLGMYRIQLSGNEYLMDKEIGLHYQLHRGIGVHQTKADRKGMPLKVSIFVGGPPAHTVSAVMPLPEGMSEMTFAGLLGGRRFRYRYVDGYCISTDADFVITGEVLPGSVKPEGPFGDHLGYYSLKHDFPLLKVHKVFARKNAIWPFTVVGRPPQEDTSFGQLIHELTGTAIPKEIPGLKEVHAVDAAGVHPLLLAVGSERYTPFAQTKQPAELLTIANHILGTGQLSLAKYLLITADETQQLRAGNIPSFLTFLLERIQWDRDVHFYTRTSMDTLDYSGDGLNTGRKVVFAAYGEPIRRLAKEVPQCFGHMNGIRKVSLAFPGVVALEMEAFKNYEKASSEIQHISGQLESMDTHKLNETAIIVLCDDASFVSAHINNFLWVCFTRSNPSHDIYGVYSSTVNKHWGCKGPLIIDARIKPHHAPAVEKDPEVDKSIEKFFNKGGSLHGIQ